MEMIEKTEGILEEIAKRSIESFILQSGMTNPEKILKAMIISAKIGISSENGELNDKEKRLTDAVFEYYWPGNPNELYRMLSSEPTENEFKWLELVCGDPRGKNLLRFVFSFAYIDGYVNNSVKERLKQLFETTSGESQFIKDMQQIKRASVQELSDIAVNAMDTFIVESAMTDPQRIFQAMVCAAKIGISSETGDLSNEQIMIAENLLLWAWNGKKSDLIKLLSEPVTEAEYRFMEKVGSNPIGRSYLKCVMVFACASGKPDEGLISRIRDCYK